jgi:hypothetical protein
MLLPQNCYNNCLIKIEAQLRNHCAMANNEKPKDKQHQDVEELATWRKKIEMIGIVIKGLDRENETGRLILRATLRIKF